MKWDDFKYGGVTYGLSHLHPRTLQFERQAQGNMPAVIFTVEVIFSLHCFTHELSQSVCDTKLLYSDSRETRLFDFERYELSKRLPDIIETLAQRKCFHTGYGNFVTVEVAREDGASVNYHVFFTASKSTRKGRINIYIQSAYVPEKRVGTTSKPIRFLVILHNTLNQLPIRSLNSKETRKGLL